MLGKRIADAGRLSDCRPRKWVRESLWSDKESGHSRYQVRWHWQFACMHSVVHLYQSAASHSTPISKAF